MQLKEEVKVEREKLKAKENGEKVSDESAPIVKALTVKVHEDQKNLFEQAIKHAMEKGNTDSKAVALEYMATDFLNKPQKVETQPDTVEQPQTQSQGGEEIEIHPTDEILSALFQELKENDGEAGSENELAGLMKVLELVEPLYPNIEIHVTVPG